MSYTTLVAAYARPANGHPGAELADHAIELAGFAGHASVQYVICNQVDQDKYNQENKTLVRNLIKLEAEGTPAIIMIEHAQWDPTEHLNEVVTDDVRKLVFLYKYKS